MIIAIDGPAASGKGTLARRLAAHYGLPHLDTGLLYRATARALLDAGSPVSDSRAALAAARRLDPAALGDDRLRDASLGEAASVVAAMQEVRAALLETQRAFANQTDGAVLDGRDIGTVIAPDADVKIFVTATSEIRAGRRHREAQARGEDAAFADILADIRRRDARDSSRSAAPLQAAADAVVLDTSALGIDQAFAAAREIVESRKRAQSQPQA